MNKYQNPMETAIGQVKHLLNNAVSKAMEKGTLPQAEIPDYVIEIPGDRKNGDFATNAAMASARAFRMAPAKIASAIVAEMELEGSYIERCEIAGPGFMNFYLSDSWYALVLDTVLCLKDDYGKTDMGKGKRILVEFVSANPTGPMHIGNARGGAIGDCLASVLSAAGYETDREFYVNDAGNQINKFGMSLSLRYQQIYKSDIEMPEDAYHGQDIVDHANAFAAEYGDKYIACSEEDRRAALVAFALPKNIQGLEDDLKKYRITYDRWFRESTLHNSGAVTDVVKLLQDKGCTYENEGAIWFKATDFGADQDFVLVRSNGVPTYVVPDIAYHYDKLVTRGYDKAIDVLGADHHGYVPRLKAALQALGADPDHLDVVLMQMVRLVRGGETVKLSKRSGKAITLVTLLDEIPIDAARFFFNLREANSHFEFDLDLAIEQSSQNPVYYVQYAYARICQIEKGLAAKEVYPISDPDFTLLTAPEERLLISHLAKLPDTVNDAAKNYDPSKMTRYVWDLAILFHKYYNACRVAVEDEALMQARLSLCLAVRIAIENVLSMLKVDTPESM